MSEIAPIDEREVYEEIVYCDVCDVPEEQCPCPKSEAEMVQALDTVRAMLKNALPHAQRLRQDALAEDLERHISNLSQLIAHYSPLSQS